MVLMPVISAESVLIYDFFWPLCFNVLNIFPYETASNACRYFPTSLPKLEFEECQFCFFPLDFVLMTRFTSWCITNTLRVLLPLRLGIYDPHDQACYSIKSVTKAFNEF